MVLIMQIKKRFPALILFCAVAVFSFAHSSWRVLVTTSAEVQQRRELPKPDRGLVPESKLYDYGVMGPPANEAIVAEAENSITQMMPAGPFAPTWESLEKNYRTPAWFSEAKFGIFLHWGLYAVPAYHNEWYAKHMYAQYAQYHT